MLLESARSLKLELINQLQGGGPLVHRVHGRITAQVQRPIDPKNIPQSPLAGGVAVGISVLAKRRYGIAVHVQDKSDDTRKVADYVRDLTHGETHVQYVGQIRPQSYRIRPLCPGVSISHPRVTAGTLGAFVNVSNSSRVHILSNSHVLAASGLANVGDEIIQPGSRDGGAPPHDSVGTLATFVPLRQPPTVNYVDAATCLLNRDISYNYSPLPSNLSGPADPESEGLVVEKIGRTTGRTRGKITDFALDNVWVSYYEPPLDLIFSDQIAVTGLGTAPFSLGGDSGALVFRTDPPEAIGLLFAGSETGVTYVNSLGSVLRDIDAKLTE
jgi:hypothetical protein